MSLLTFIKPCAIFLSIRMEIKDTSRRSMENIVRDNENPCVRNWKELGQRACLQKRAEEREAAAGCAVFWERTDVLLQLAYWGGGDEHLHSEEKMMEAVLEAILLSSEFLVYLIPSMGVINTGSLRCWHRCHCHLVGTGILSPTVCIQPGICSSPVATSHFHHYQLSFSPCFQSASPESLHWVLSVEPSLSTWCIWPAQIWMSLGRTHITRLAAGSIISRHMFSFSACPVKLLNSQMRNEVQIHWHSVYRPACFSGLSSRGKILTSDNLLNSLRCSKKFFLSYT